MKHITTTLILFLAVLYLNAQETQLISSDLDEAAQIELAQKKVLDCCLTVLSTPIDKKDEKRITASELIVHWMESTPDYSFTIGEDAYVLTKGNTALLNVYLACLVKSTLEDVNPYENAEQVTLNCLHAFLDYCENDTNNAKPPKEVKRLLEARAAGNLSETMAAN